MVEAAAYAPPLRASMSPVGLKRTIAARLVYPVAAPSDRPTTPFMAACDGVASNWTPKDPVWLANGVFCHDPAGVVCTHADAVLTLSETAAVWLSEAALSAPVMVSVEVPAGVVLEVATLSVEEPEPPLIVAGLKLPVAPAGSPLRLRLTVSVNP